MASDEQYYGDSGYRAPFNSFATSADASGNGVEVVAAADTGKSHYITGAVLNNQKTSALTITLGIDAASASVASIAPAFALAANTGSITLDYSGAPLKVGSAKNAGIFTSASGQVSVQLFGYTAKG